MMASFS